jgi:hypothetical protein
MCTPSRHNKFKSYDGEYKIIFAKIFRECVGSCFTGALLSLQKKTFQPMKTPVKIRTHKRILKYSIIVVGHASKGQMMVFLLSFQFSTVYDFLVVNIIKPPKLLLRTHVDLTF